MHKQAEIDGGTAQTNDELTFEKDFAKPKTHRFQMGTDRRHKTIKHIK